MTNDELSAAVEKIRDDLGENNVKTEMVFQNMARLQHQMDMLFKMFVGTISFVVVICLLALVYGALGGHGFNAVTKSAPVILPNKDDP